MQVVALTCLQHISLDTIKCRADGYSALLQLTNLTALHMPATFAGTPACLPQLTQLKALNLWNDVHNDDDLAQALPSLQRLTALHLGTALPALLGALRALQQLQALACCTLPQPYPLPCYTPSGSGIVLPAGAWLAPLRWLLLPANLLRRSLPALATAKQLKFIGSFFRPGDSQQLVVELVEWACRQPQLRWLLLSIGSMQLEEAVQQQVHEAQRIYPALTLHIFQRYDDMKCNQSCLRLTWQSFCPTGPFGIDCSHCMHSVLSCTTRLP
jgi:hypothetical protein